MATRTNAAPRRRRPPGCCSACRRCALPDVGSLAELIDERLRAAGTRERAAGEKRYLKSDLHFYGVTVPVMRATVRDTIRARKLDHDATVTLAEQLWRAPVHERRMAAVDVLAFRVGQLTAQDLSLVERLLRDAGTWALVDGLAIFVAGEILRADSSSARTLDAWVADPDFWLQRAALLTWIPAVRAEIADLSRIERYCDALLEEKEFFVRKAIGWLLREISKKDPQWVVRFLEPRRARASTLTVREATRRLPS